MTVHASAPGKLVVLGEYAVLNGAPALVMAVDRRCHVDIGVSDDGLCHLATIAPDRHEASFAAGRPSGSALIDLIVGDAPGGCCWSASVDTREFFAAAGKLGIGSSAAVLAAWATAWSRFTDPDAAAGPQAGLARLIALHRRFQGDKGSGLDIAASLMGGVIEFRSGQEAAPSADSVMLPDGVGFVAVYSGRAAATGPLVSAFDAWREARPAQAAARLGRLRDLAEQGCAAARGNDAAAFLASLAAYGRELGALGDAIGVELVTKEHREITGYSERSGVVYKISGAGGGDLGVAFSADPEALKNFRAAVMPTYEIVELAICPSGTRVEER